MLAFDTETTGLLKPETTKLHLQPFMTEIYMCKFDEDFNIIGEFDHLVKPPFPIPEFISRITGITNEMVADKPEFIDIYDEFCDFVNGETISFAHNHSFDTGVIRYELERHDLQYRFPWPKTHYCTVELSEPIRNKRLKLAELYEIATGNKEITGAHRAANDVHAMVDCIKWLHEKKFWRM